MRSMITDLPKIVKVYEGKKVFLYLQFYSNMTY